MNVTAVLVSYMLLMNKLPAQLCLISSVVKTPPIVTKDVHNFLMETNHYKVRRAVSIPVTTGSKLVSLSQPHSKEASVLLL
jgi:hypothetical protein